ncbi:hypothetical protein MBLNU459_g5722t1 [Dothideomycetes sp. NU459]
MFVWLNGDDSRPPALFELRSSRWFIVSSVAAAVFTDLFLYGIVVPVLPFALSSRAGVAAADIQTWISILLAVYGGALLVASPFCGWFADRSSNRRTSLLVGLLTLAGSTVFLTVGSSIAVFVVGRILQGFSAAVVWVVGLALLADTVGQDHVGYYMGYVGMAMSLSVLLAPLLGGIVFDRAGYYAVYAMAYALIGVDIVMRIALIEKKVAMRWRKPGAPADASSAPGEEEPGELHLVQQNEPFPTASARDTKSHADSSTQSCPVVPQPEAQREPPQEPPRPSIQDDSETPTQAAPTHWISRLPPVFTLLKSARLNTALGGSLIQSALLTSFDSILPIYVRDTFHWNSIGAGLVFLPLVIPTLAAPAIGHASDRYGPRWLGTAGFILAIPCLVLLRLVTRDTLGQKALLCALLALLGLTLNLILTPLMAEVMYAVEAKAAKRPAGYFGRGGAYAQAYGLFNMAFAAGSMAGPLLAGLINQHRGWGTTTLVLACLSAGTAVPTVIWSGGSIFKQRRREKEMRAVRDAEDGRRA